jgi:hypothetical protein
VQQCLDLNNELNAEICDFGFFTEIITIYRWRYLGSTVKYLFDIYECVDDLFN